ncbi:MAG: restriction endonuclease subunit S, partial [Acidimicrobiales bacterium]
MVEKWQRCQLRDLCQSIDYGLTASATDEPAGPKFLRITDIVRGGIDWKEVPYVAASDADRIKYSLRHGDIVVARTGATTGFSACVLHPPEAVFASYLVRFAVRPEHDPRYVGYALKSPLWWAYIHGVLGDKSAQPNASANTLADGWVDVPPLPEQCAIAEVLGALDDKIEANRHIEAAAWAVAQAQFDALTEERCEQV